MTKAIDTGLYHGCPHAEYIDRDFSAWQWPDRRGVFCVLIICDGMAAMQSIMVVINPIFLGVLFGTAVLALFLGFGAIRHLADPRAIWIVTGAGLYVIGTVVVTMIFNVPLNNALAAVDPASSEGAAVWADYLRTWTNWNHVRGLAALAASGAFIFALFAA